MEKRLNAWMTVAVLRMSANNPYSAGPRKRAVKGRRKKLKARIRKFAAKTYKVFFRKVMTTRVTYPTFFLKKPLIWEQTKSNSSWLNSGYRGSERISEDSFSAVLNVPPKPALEK